MITEVKAPLNCERDFVPRSEGARLVRELLGQQLTDWHLARLEDAAALIATELFTNCFRAHDAKLRRGDDADNDKVFVSLSANDSVLQIVVADNIGGTITVKSPSPDDESGRGLLIVAALAISWGIHYDGACKCVYVNLQI